MGTPHCMNVKNGKNKAAMSLYDHAIEIDINCLSLAYCHILFSKISNTNTTDG